MTIKPLTSERRGGVHARPCLKWAGGKRQLLPRLLPRLPQRWGRYHEPFVGGGALFFELNARTDRHGRWAVLTDTNERLIRTYHAVCNQLPKVVDILLEHLNQHSKEWYYTVRSWDVDALTDPEVAGWMIYLNRTGFNGLYRVNSKNKFNVPFGRYQKPNICDRTNLARVKAALKHAELHHDGFERVLDDAVEGDLVYFDPPYVPLSTSSSFTAYTKGGFGPDEQRRLRDTARTLKARGVHVVLSNHDTEGIRELYAEGFHVERIPATRRINSKASKRGAINEVIIT